MSDGAVRVKICGLTRVEDALAAERAGADAIGLIFAARSKRRLTLERAATICEAVGPFVSRVGVFVDAPLEEVLETARTLKLSAVQLHGSEDAAYAEALRKRVTVIKAFSFGRDATNVVQAFPADAVLIDGVDPGSGIPFDWSAASRLRVPHLILAGGLTADNVAEAVKTLQPYAVDSASGVESSPGIKDARKIQDFVRAAKAVPLSTVIHRLS